MNTIFQFHTFSYPKSSSIVPMNAFGISGTACLFLIVSAQRANFEVEFSTLFRRFFNANKKTLKYRRRFDVESTSKLQSFFDDRRNILTFFNAFSTTVKFRRRFDVESTSRMPTGLAFCTIPH